jgi:hypothetical protein
VGRPPFSTREFWIKLTPYSNTCSPRVLSRESASTAVLCEGKVAAQTDAVPLSKTGDAKVKAKVTVPSDCANPVIVLRERYEGKVGGWLAATGR